MSRHNQFIFNKPVKGRGFVAPHYSKGAHSLVRAISTPYLRLSEGIGQVEFVRGEELLNAFVEDKRGGQRLIIAFRHPSKHDPPVLTWAFNKLLPRLARQIKRKVDFIPHARFLYGKDVLNWAGAISVWLFPRIGQIPVENRGANREGLDLLRRELLEGEFPIALAPEGQVSYHQYKCFPIAPGVGSLARWTVEGGRGVRIIPLALQYRFAADEAHFIVDVLNRWSGLTGIELKGDGVSSKDLYQQILEATDHTLSLLEEEYFVTPESRGSLNPKELQIRVAILNHSILCAGEKILGLETHGDILDRVFRLRYICMERFYPEKYSPETLPPVQREQKAYQALEARIIVRHSQIVDVLEYLDPDYISPEGRLDRMCEYVQSLLDILNRMRGGNVNSRYVPLKKKVKLHIGNAINSDSFSADLKGRNLQNEINRQIYDSLTRLSVGMPEF